MNTDLNQHTRNSKFVAGAGGDSLFDGIGTLGNSLFAIEALEGAVRCEPGSTVSRSAAARFVTAAARYAAAAVEAGLADSLIRRAQLVSETVRKRVGQHRSGDQGQYVSAAISGHEGTSVFVRSPLLTRAEFENHSFFIHEDSVEDPKLELGCYFLLVCLIALDDPDQLPGLDRWAARSVIRYRELITGPVKTTANALLWEGRRLANGWKLVPPATVPSSLSALLLAELGPRTAARPGAGKTRRKKWYVGPDKPPSHRFYTAESLEGTKKELSMAFYTKVPGEDNKRVMRKAKRGIVFVRKLSGQHWEVFFRTKREFDTAKDRLDKYRQKKAGQSAPKLVEEGCPTANLPRPG